VFYYLIASLGYLSTGVSTNDIVPDRDTYKKGMVDYYMLIGKITNYVSLILSIPLVYHPFRRSLLNLIRGPRYNASMAM